jgi:hypothetical protein
MATAITPRWCRAAQAREYLGGMSDRTFRRLVASGAVKGFKLGRTTLFDLTALDRQVMRGRTTGAPDARRGKAESKHNPLKVELTSDDPSGDRNRRAPESANSPRP